MSRFPDDGRLRLTILGGYLGSGKTTWLRHQLFEGVFRGAHILVNEAAETPVDDTLLASQAASVTMLAGGCACCTGKDDLVAALRMLSDSQSRKRTDDRSTRRIVLETSGLADPAAILDAIQKDSVLVHHIRVDEIVVLVDALNAADQLRTEYLGRAQIEAADRIILTKVDLVPDPTLATVLATVRKLNPAAKIEAAVKGQEFALPDLPEVPPYNLPRIKDAGEAIAPTRIDIPDDVDWAGFSVWLSALLYARGDDLVRVKGVFETPAGPLLIQAVRKSVQPPELLPPEAGQRQNQIVFIGRGYTGDELRRSLNYFARC
ncbi:CobW family GTP-binding protein [Thalassovita aquimarina]|uniref:GTP-binding protein n=1 Tax=Thalassovita aquimarina TaxID=2785917 RepID=A0ABS5HQX1_9RHOB|nr:CobW family GTP-binding protein [Thalassovita aquimarina]MBR9651342.1 GTP-binding protein [Thalassovita aquimarina]